jgi:uncharacterized membrane protein YjgN (DUF898 family)
MSNLVNWFYAVGTEKQGPFDEATFQARIADGTIRPETLVWKEGMDSWKPLSALTGATAGAPPTVPGGEIAFSFGGSGGEYFRIWIVNLVLTILTLGLYAAWAKVRNRRYFYSQTGLFGHAFEYTGNPVRILIGNLIVMGMAFAYFLSAAVAPPLLLVVLAGLLVLTPWFIIKSLSFNARNSVYRGVRFGFDGTYGKSALAFLGLPVLSALSLGLAAPWVYREQRSFVVSHHRYGTSPFSLSAPTGSFYRIFVLAVLFFLPLLLAYGGIIAYAIAHGAANKGQPPPPEFALLGLTVLPGLLLAVVGRYFFQARMFNLIWNGTRLGSHGFRATLRLRDLLLVQVSNGLLVMITLGLAYPWAKVRTVRLMLDALRFVPNGSLDDITAAPDADQTALGDSAGDFFDFDVGIGL